MPVLYCDSCRRDTQHKEVLCRLPKDNIDISLKAKLQQFSKLMSQLMNGVHYHKMGPVCLCRNCNQKNNWQAESLSH